ncbi:MAG: NUDIX domain-containing protein, partial [Betaproteobacteria bacterium]|nr:NUDIX domain-containing protein [Betaproteobacteria bacterium]
MVIDVAAGVLINPQGKVLLAQRPQGKVYAGWWEVPGGKFEPGEDAHQALA